MLPPQDEGGTAISRNSVMPGYLTGLQQSCEFELTFVLPTKPTNCLYFSVLAVLNGCKVVLIFTVYFYIFFVCTCTSRYQWKKEFVDRHRNIDLINGYMTQCVDVVESERELRREVARGRWSSLTAHIVRSSEASRFNLWRVRRGTAMAERVSYIIRAKFKPYVIAGPRGKPLQRWDSAEEKQKV